jgi:hypothetical protein
LTEYIQDFIARFGEDHEVVIFLAADHGMRYGEFHRSSSAMQEHRLPAFFLITSHNYLGKHEYSYDILTHNTKRLTTKPDLRQTMLDIAREWVGKSAFKESKKEQKLTKVNLLKQKVADSRTCEESGIPVWY